ncbi:fungal-specific transcription factor domain-containing protein, partial [Cantharellus anzutake]|uniref:fungal-specific transcription factor domain-containing protein n=1 Tax=Cantharellus anzutake TaxID=1750568 RepID=UPI00190698FB
MSGQMVSPNVRARSRACDFCRKRKIRCDGYESSSTRCSPCLEYGNDCTYLNPTGRRRDHSMRDVQYLEARVKHVQALIVKHLPEHYSLPRKDLTSNEQSSPELGASFDLIWNNPNFDKIFQDFLPQEECARGEEAIQSIPFQLNCNHPEHVHRYHGEASGLNLIQTADEIKRDTIGLQASAIDRVRPAEVESVSWREAVYGNPEGAALPRVFAFPTPDLAHELFELFFRFFHPFFPILHRQTFESQYADGLHKRDHDQAVLLQSVCAVAAIYSNDPRVYGPLAGRQVRGMRYMRDAVLRECSFRAATLQDLQALILRIFYSQYLGEAHQAWVQTGIAIRHAQDVGAHRKSFRDSKNPVEAEMWKRVFWALISIERYLGSVIGHSSCVHPPDWELDLPKHLPLEGKNIEFFRHSLKLGSLMMATRTVLWPVRARKETIF